MLSQQNLIYLGIALLIVGIAFFAYQELQKHHTEIEKLRMQSQKLEKIIYAYNMRQWHQSTDPYLNDGAADDDESDESGSESESESHSDTDTNNMTSFIRQTINSIGTPAGPSKVTISAGGKTMQFPVTPQITQNDASDIPDVETFDVSKNVKNDNGNDNVNDDQSNKDNNLNSELLNEMEQNDFDIHEDKSEEKSYENSTTCNVKIKMGDRKGEVCGSAAKAKGMCLRHFRQENKIH